MCVGVCVCVYACQQGTRERERQRSRNGHQIRESVYVQRGRVCVCVYVTAKECVSVER